MSPAAAFAKNREAARDLRQVRFLRFDGKKTDLLRVRSLGVKRTQGNGAHMSGKGRLAR
jgi:hypothetical protein